MSSKARLFWPLAITLLVADCSTKSLAVEHLSPAHVPHAVVGDWLQLTLTYNTGVVDFIDVGVGTHRFYTFNVADACITVGVVALAVALWRTPRTFESEL